MRGKTLTKTDNLRTASNFAKQEARTAKEKTQQVLKVSSPEVCPNKSTPEAISGQKTDFAKQEARTVKEKTQQVLKASSPEICPNKSTSEAISGQKKVIPVLLLLYLAFFSPNLVVLRIYPQFGAQGLFLAVFRRACYTMDKTQASCVKSISFDPIFKDKKHNILEIFNIYDSIMYI